MHYNYGAKENLRRYGQREPWIYDLKRVTAPVYIYYGDNDLISTPKVSPYSCLNRIQIHDELIRSLLAVCRTFYGCRANWATCEDFTE